MIFAFINTTRLAKLIEGTLATAGGFLLGYLLIAIIGWLIDKYLLKRKSPEFLHKVCRLIGGLIVAILVALMVFGGGGGEGDGMGDGAGNGKASPTQGTQGPIEPSPTTDSKAIPSNLASKVEERIRVTILGGSDVQNQKFYLLDDATDPLAFADLKSAIQKRKESTSKTLGIEIYFNSRNALPKDHPAVTQLVRWANDLAGLTVAFPVEAP